MPVGSRKIRTAFLLEAVATGVVVTLCMFVLAYASGNPPFATPLAWGALGVALATIAAAAWATYQATRRTLEPVNWLLGKVARWDPHRPDTQSFSPNEIPPDVQGVTRRLAEAVHGLGQRLSSFVRREQEFTRNASHEMRTPLTVIRVAADLISHDPGLSVGSRRSLGHIHAASAAMEAMMDALLLLARDERIALEEEDFPAREVVETEIDKIRPLLDEKTITLDVQMEGAPELHAPPRVLGVMLGNLLSNAARFTDTGQIRVRLLQDRLEVEDTGIGMDAAALARAFEPFYRVDATQSGSGLGLSIAQRLGQRCGWPLQLDSAPGQGTRATILFGSSIRH